MGSGFRCGGVGFRGCCSVTRVEGFREELRNFNPSFIFGISRYMEKEIEATDLGVGGRGRGLSRVLGFRVEGSGCGFKTRCRDDAYG